MSAAAAVPRKSPSPQAEQPDLGSLLPVLILLAIFTVNQWSRSLIFYVVDFGKPPTEETMRLFMNLDVGFDQAQYGVLASIGFSVLFSVTSLFAGSAVYRV